MPGTLPVNCELPAVLREGILLGKLAWGGYSQEMGASWNEEYYVLKAGANYGADGSLWIVELEGEKDGPGSYWYKDGVQKLREPEPREWSVVKHKLLSDRARLSSRGRRLVGVRGEDMPAWKCL